MNVKLEITPETAAKLLALAQARGVSVEELLLVHVPGLASTEPELSGPERAQAF